MLGTILLVFAFVFACVAAAQVPDLPRVRWGWLAIAFWIASILFSDMSKLLH